MEYLLLAAFAVLAFILTKGRSRRVVAAGSGRGVAEPELVVMGPASLGHVPDQVDWQRMEQAFARLARAHSRNDVDQAVFAISAQVSLVTTQIDQLVEAGNDHERRLRMLEGSGGQS